MSQNRAQNRAQDLQSQLNKLREQEQALVCRLVENQKQNPETLRNLLLNLLRNLKRNLEQNPAPDRLWNRLRNQLRNLEQNRLRDLEQNLLQNLEQDLLQNLECDAEQNENLMQNLEQNLGQGLLKKLGQNRLLQEAPTTKRYLKLADILLIIATFAGTVTFTVLLTITTASNSPPPHVKTLLGLAAALFLGSVTGIFPIILSLQRFKDDQRPGGIFLFFAWFGYGFIALLMSAAFFLLMVVLKYYNVQSAFILGVALLGISSLLSILMAFVNWRSLK